MQALRLKLHQHNAVYRNPIGGEIVETYPLVPPSTVLGLISSTLQQQELKSGSFNISIQGNYGALIRDYQWYKKYNEKTETYQDHRYPLLVHSLYDVNLVLHIFAGEEFVLKDLSKIFRNPPYFLYLGRAEDIIKIDGIQIVDVRKQKLTESHYLKYNTYIQPTDAKSLRVRGVAYTLASYSKIVPWTIKKQIRKVRDFEWTSLIYIESGTRIEIDMDSEIECWTDGENLLWWSLPNPPL